MLSPEERIKRRREASLRWYYNHKDHAKEYAKVYNLSHRQQMNQKTQKWRAKQPPSYKLYAGAQTRANEKSLPFSICPSDVVIPSVCPVLGIPIITGRSVTDDNSPSLDRIVPEKGYVKGNIAVISRRANTIKSYGNAQEHLRVAKFLLNFFKEN